MKHEKMMSRILCLLLTAALMLGLVGCVNEPAPTTTTPVTAPSTAPTVPTTLPTEPSVPPTTEPLPPVDANKLEYTLTQEDVDEFYRLLDECEQLSIEGTDMEAIEAISDKLDDQLEYLYAQNSIAMIIYYFDKNVEGMEQRHLDCVEICTDAADAYNQSARRIYLSDTPAKDMLFEGWTQKDIDMLLRYDERIAQLQQRNSEIEVAYRDSASDTEKMKLYVEFIQNNNEMAQIYGYDNYYTYAYDIVYERDYGMDKIEQMRQYAKQYLTTSFEWALKKFQSSFYQVLDSYEQKKVIAFLYDDYKTLPVDYVERYMGIVPGELKQQMDQMLTADSMFSNQGASLTGAFTTSIGDRSYCFFGRGYSSVNTIIHEAGHYYASRYADLNSIPMDLAEVHSQGNEWMFLTHISKTMKPSEFKAIRSYNLYNNVTMMLICLMVDEFEQRVYSTDVSKFTAKDFDAIMTDVASQYFSMDYIKENLTDVNSYWRAVVVEQPVYYISYAVSVVSAIDLYSIASKDYDAAAEIYRKLCEEPLEEGGFLANISAVGLASPFDEEFYKGLTALIKK